MKPKILIILILVLISGQVCSQELNFTWSKTAGTSGNNSGKNIIYDNAGYLYVAGEFYGDFSIGDSLITGFANRNIFIIKFDLDGKLIWAKSMGSNVPGNIYNFLGQICFDANMNIVCTGTFSDALILNDTIINSNGGTDIFILRIKNTGEILSVSSDGGIGDENSNSICVDKNDNIYICGGFTGITTFGSQTLTSSGYWQYTPWGDSVYLPVENGFFSKYDNQLNCLFSKQICKNRSVLYSIISDTTDNIYTTGYFSSFNNLTDTIANHIGNFLVFKYDQDGNLINLIQEGSNNNFILAKALAIDNENNLLVTGSIECSGCIFGDSLLPSGSTDAFLVKYDHLGQMKWINLLGQDHDADGNNNSGNSILIDNNNNIVIAGYFDYLDLNGVIMEGNNSSIDFLVMKFDKNGSIINIGKYGYSTWDTGESVTLDSANNIYFTGYTYLGATSTSYPSYIFVAKIYSIPALGIADLVMHNNIQIYPNPSHGSFTIDLPANINQPTIISVSNIEGKVLYIAGIYKEHNEIILKEYKPGLYILKIKVGNMTYNKKLLIH
jgi:hypothetical protein